jgi:hypothetical protein
MRQGEVKDKSMFSQQLAYKRQEHNTDCGGGEQWSQEIFSDFLEMWWKEHLMWI